MLPRLILGGAPKSGTTSLCASLAQHPEVWMSPVKEPHFFSQTPDTSPQGRRFSRAEYEALFDGAAPGQTAAEGSTSYLGRASIAAPRIAHAIPDVRLVFVLRNPIDRAYSDYWFHLHRGELPSRYPFAHYAEQPDHWLFNGGRYAVNLRLFLEQVSADQLLTLLTSELRAEPGRVLADVCRHAGVDPGLAPAELLRENVTVYPRSPRALRALGRVAPGVGRAVSRNAVLRPLRSRALFSRSAAKPPLAPALRQRLADRMEPETRALEALLGRDLSAWRAPA